MTLEALLAVPGTAQAQTFPKLETASAEAARAQIVQSIERQGRWDVWENIATGRTPELRHRQSGARCRFWDEKVFLNVDTTYFYPSWPVGAGESVSCSTWITVAGPANLSFETRIIAAPFALNGEIYRFFDGKGTPDRVTPAYLAWRSVYWHGARIGAVVHEPVRTIQGPGGRPVAVYGVRTTIYGDITSRALTVMLGGWVVTQRFAAPRAHDREALELALSQLEYTITTMDRPHAAAAAQQALVETTVRTEALRPPGADGDIALVARNAFKFACVSQRRAGKPYAPAEGWREWTLVDAPAGLPHTAKEAPAKAWLVQEGPTGRVYVHYDAAMTGDCAVSIYGADAERTWRGLLYLLTRDSEAPFALGAYPVEGEGRFNAALDGNGWEAEGSLIASKDPGDRPSVFIGLRGPMRVR